MIVVLCCLACSGDVPSYRDGGSGRVIVCGVVLHPVLELRDSVFCNDWNFDAGNFAVQCWVLSIAGNS